MSDPSPALRFEPEDLDGHTLDELADYLDRGRHPADLSIDESPACLIALDALARLRATADAFLDDDDSTAQSEDWISAVMASIPLDARPGRSFAVPTSYPDVTASVTEGALRGLVRTIGDGIPGLLVGRVRFDPTARTALEVEVALIHGSPLAAAVERLRRTLLDTLPAHVPFPIERIDVHVIGLIELTEDRA